MNLNEKKANPAKKDKSGPIIHQKQLHSENSLPSPEELAEYKQVIPGFPEKIVEMIERNQENRIAEDEHKRIIEKMWLKEELKLDKLGLIFAFVIVILVLIGTVTCAFINQPTVAVVLASAAIVSVVAKFIRGSKGGENVDTEIDQSQN
jgi:uncharacterized membrane protein